MTSTSIVKKLSKKGVPGRYKPLFLDRHRGKRDYKYSQVVSDSNNEKTTPWIVGKYETLAEYEGLIYNRIDHATEPIAKLVSSECKELELIEYAKPKKTDNSEISERNAAQNAAENEANRLREKSILLHLASIKSEIEMIDLALKHHIQRAENTTRAHICAYWGGVLRAAGEEGEHGLPPNPVAFSKEISGRDAYEKHFDTVMERINEALGRRPNNETDR